MMVIIVKIMEMIIVKIKSKFFICFLLFFSIITFLFKGFNVNADDSEYYSHLSKDEIKDIMEKYSLKKKYCCDFAELINLRDKAEEELKNIKSNSDEIKNIQEEKSRLLKEVSEKAKELSVKRIESAKKFSEQVTSQLKFLNMENVKIEVEQKTGKLTLNGMDSLEIMISTNPGEPLKPISKIASGGELSRIMLAIKNIISYNDTIGTLIFDEIDTGVSGRASQKIGLKLKSVSKNTQVICVTHSAQIASNADEHFLIEKKFDNNNTFTFYCQYFLDASSCTAQLSS